jgi:ABC-type transport system involved in cytochrome c biogenesis permease subunit
MADGSPMVLVAGGLVLLSALAYLVRRQAGLLLGAMGAAVLVGALGARGIRAGYWPLTNQYEFALAFALATALAALTTAVRRKGLSVIQAATMLLSALLIVLARLGMPSFRRAVRSLPPVLDSAWLPLHVGAAALGYGALAMAGVSGAVWLAWRRSRSEAENLIGRAIAVGYPLLTLSMLLGMVWAQQAWGRYWNWDLKETWTLITWLAYTLYWHLQRRPRWKGRWMAWLALVGLGSVLFTLFGVGWLARQVGLESLHLF